MGSEHKGPGHIAPFQLPPRMWQQHDGFQPSTGTAAICHCGQLALSGAELIAGDGGGAAVGSSSQIPTNGAFHSQKIMRMRLAVARCQI